MEKSKRPLLSWTLDDYKKNGIEPPEELSEFPGKTEGELMKYDEVLIWYKDTFETFIVLKDYNYNVFLEIRDNFLKDLKYLNKIGIIPEEVITNTLKDELFK